MYGLPSYLHSSRAYSGWLIEAKKDQEQIQKENNKSLFPFPAYTGQDSTVVNLVNDWTLEQPLVNPF